MDLASHCLVVAVLGSFVGQGLKPPCKICYRTHRLVVTPFACFCVQSQLLILSSLMLHKQVQGACRHAACCLACHTQQCMLPGVGRLSLLMCRTGLLCPACRSSLSYAIVATAKACYLGLNSSSCVQEMLPGSLDELETAVTSAPYILKSGCCNAVLASTKRS